MDVGTLLARRMAAMAYRIVNGRQTLIYATLLSRNADGTLNFDDGKGGCILVRPPTNVRTGSTVLTDITAPMSWALGLPTVRAAQAPAVKVTPPPEPARLPILPARLVDADNGSPPPVATGQAFDLGTGANTAADQDTPDYVAAYGYSHVSTDVDKYYFGPSPDHNAIQIGEFKLGDHFSGYFGSESNDFSNHAVLGLGPSTNVICCIEQEIDASGGTVHWSVVFRDAATYTIVRAAVATFMDDFIAAHLQDPEGPDHVFNVANHSSGIFHWGVSADLQGNFWICLNSFIRGTRSLTYELLKNPCWKISGADGSVLETVLLDPASVDLAITRLVRQPPEWIKNPGFELGANGDWTVSSVPDGGPVIGAATPHKGTKAAGLRGYGTAGTDSISQVVALGAATSPRLEFWLQIATDDLSGAAHDTMAVEIRSADGSALLATLATFSNADAGDGNYHVHSYDITAHANTTFMLRFTATEDASAMTSFTIDDVHIRSLD